MNKSLIIVVVLILVFIAVGVQFARYDAGQQSQNFTTVALDSAPKQTGIVNDTKKITGETSHNKRVNFNTHADVLKYSPDTGKNLAFNKVKIQDTAKKIIRKDAEKIIIATALAEDSVGAAASAATATSIEDIILGTILL